MDYGPILKGSDIIKNIEFQSIPVKAQLHTL